MPKWGIDQWGSDPWGLGFGEPLSLAVSSVNPSTISSEGGDEIVLLGEFATGVNYTVHIGYEGTNDDPAIYSGIVEQGYIIQSTDGSSLRGYTPPINAGNPTITIMIGSEKSLFNGYLTVIPRVWPSKAFSLRRKFQPIFSVGKRRLTDEGAL